MRLHTISDTVLHMHAMEDRIARALNCLGEDMDLSADTNCLLDLLDDYLDDDDPSGKIPPSTHYYSTTNITKSNNVILLVITEFNNNNTTLVACDESMEGVEDPSRRQMSWKRVTLSQPKRSSL